MIRRLIAAAFALVAASAFGQAGNLNNVFATAWNGINSTSWNGTKVAQAAPVDAYLNFAGETNGTVVDATNIATGSIGTLASNSANWQKSGSETTSLAYAASQNSLWANIIAGGTNYPVATTSKAIGYDSNVGTGTFLMKLGNISTSSKALTVSAWFTANQAKNNSSAYDVVRTSNGTLTDVTTFNDGAFSGIYGLNLENNASGRSFGITLTAATAYRVSFKTDYNAGLLSEIIQDSTGAVTGSMTLSESTSTVPTFIQIGNGEGHVQQTGVMYFENYLVDWTNAASVIGKGSIATPSPTLAQNDNSSLTVSWTSGARSARVDKSTAGAEPVQLTSDTNGSVSGAQTYVDSSVSNGVSYAYRLMPFAGPISAAPTTTSSLTFNSTKYITANAPIFDGTTNYIGINSTPTNLTSSKVFTFSGWVKFSSDPGSREWIVWDGYTGPNQIFFISRESSEKIRVFGANNSNVSLTTVFDATTTSATITGTAWHHLYICVDMDTQANCKVYIDGTSQALTVATFTTGQLIEFAPAHSGPAFGIGGRQADGNGKVHGTLCEFWMKNVYLDSPGLFAQAGKTLNLGSTGQTPTGASPAMYYSLVGTANSWASDSSGNSNNLTVTGSTLGTGTPP